MEHITNDYSAWGMYQSADIVVKFVMVGLVIASFISWMIFAGKSIQQARYNRELRKLYKPLRLCQDMEGAQKICGTRSGRAREMLDCALSEIGGRAQYLSAAGIKERALWRIECVVADGHRSLIRGSIVVATIGAVAPFVGLFGTVWGIMNSFIGIAEANTTSLSVIAPGIAEALLATGLGLVAAIPAVIFNNILARGAGGYKVLLVGTATEIMRILSRSLDMDEIAGVPNNVHYAVAE